VGEAGLAENQKGAARRKATIVFWDESGISVVPVVRSTWAPKGRTPVLHHPFSWKRASMAAALCIRPRGGGAQLAFHIQPGSYNTDSLIVALTELRGFLGGEKATLIWDGLSSHRSRAMRTWLGQQRSWLVVERLPAYAPDLNPVEKVWSNVKGVELANLTSEHLSDITAAAHAGIDRIRSTPRLLYSFLHATGLRAW
jgi:DDE superfamily endonuclease